MTKIKVIRNFTIEFECEVDTVRLTDEEREDISPGEHQYVDEDLALIATEDLKNYLNYNFLDGMNSWMFAQDVPIYVKIKNIYDGDNSAEKIDGC